MLLVAGTLAFDRGEDDWHRPVSEPQADAAYYYAYLPSLVLDRDLDFTNQYEVTNNWYRLGKTPTGRPSNVFGIGPAVFQLPVFVVGHALAIATGDRRDGFSTWETWPVMWSGLVFAIGALVFAARLVRRRAGGAGVPAWVGPVLAALAGPVAYYVLRQPGYAHPYATFFTAALVDTWDASFGAAAGTSTTGASTGTRTTSASHGSAETPGPRTRGRWIAMGALLGAAALARPQLALWAVLLVPAVVDDVRRRGDVSWATLVGRWACGAAASLVVFAPQLLAWHALYGAWYTVPQGPDFMRWDAPQIAATLFSSRNGLFPWAPLWLPLLLGLIPLGRRLGPTLVVGLLLQAVANGAAWDWWAGGSFGGRRFDSTYIVFAVGAGGALAVLWRARPHAHAAVRIAWRAAAAALTAWAIALALSALWLAMHTNVIDAKIAGGDPADPTWRARGGAYVGAVAARTSRLVTLPARALFAWRHGLALDAYDRNIGVHVLGETYPGLNSFPDKTSDVAHWSYARARGVAIQPGYRATVTDPAGATLLVGLNRRGRVRIRLGVDGDAPVALAWNGEPLATTMEAAPISSDGPTRFAVATATDLDRGTNTLAIAAPTGTSLREPELFAEP